MSHPFPVPADFFWMLVMACFKA